MNLEQARRDGNLVKALCWLGPDQFRWCICSLIVPVPNEHGQYVVQRIRNGWYAATDRVRNLTQEEKERVLLGD